MSASIDERLVSMKFKAEGFQKGAADVKKSIAGLKENFSFGKAKAAIGDLQGSFGKFNTGTMSTAIEGLASRFDTLRVVGVTALSTLASMAVQKGQQMLSGMLTPLKAGFGEYELTMGSIQTILANTAKDGTNLKQVTSALDELNAYADKTIYNFGDMTKNIGLFTNAGIKLQDATTMIKGFSNEAAASGTTSEGAAGAAYQLSQALSAGEIRLMDWRSLTNVGMGNANMKRGIIEIADAMGTLDKSGVSSTEVTKDFNGTLEKGWLTADVMSSYLKIMSGDMDAAAQKALGLSDAQVASFAKQQNTAQDAAQKVRTFTQLMGTIQESIGSSWSETFRTVLGDFDSATTLFTGINDTVGKAIGDMGNARNAMLKGWAKMGGRDVAVQALTNAGKALLSILTPIKAAWASVFPPSTGKGLYAITVGIEKFTKALILNKPSMEGLKNTFKGVFSIFAIAGAVIKGVFSVIGDIFTAFSKGGNDAGGGLLSFTGSIGEFIEKVREFLVEGGGIQRFFTGLGKIVTAPIVGIQALAAAVVAFTKGLFSMDLSGFGNNFEKAFGRVGDRLQTFAELGPIISKAWGKVGEFFSNLWTEYLAPFFVKVGEFGGQVGDALKNGFKSGDFSKVLDLINTGFIAGIFLLFNGFFSKLKGLFKSKGGAGGGIGGLFKEMLGPVTEIFEGLTGTLSAMQNELKSKTLMNLAIAIGIMAASVLVLSLIDSEKLTKALTALTIMFVQLSGALAVFTKIAGLGGIAKVPVLAFALILLGGAILILSGAVKVLSTMDWDELARGLTGVTVLIGLMVGASKVLTAKGPGMIASSFALLIFAGAIAILGKAVQGMSKLSWDELARGLSGIAAVLVAVALFDKFNKATKSAAVSAINIFLLAGALKLFASAVEDFSKFKLGAIAQGMAGVAVMLSLMIAYSKSMKNPVGMIATAAAMIVLAFALKEFAKVVEMFGNMDLVVLGKGLAAMAVGLAIIVGAMALLNVAGGGLAGALAIAIVAASIGMIGDAIADMGGMGWEEIAKAMVVLAGSLGIIALALWAMQATLPGAAALVVAAGALSLLAPAMVALSGLTWGEIGAGLGALGIALAILAVGGIALLPAIPGLMGLGLALGLIGIGVGVAAAGIGLLALGLVALGAAGPLGALGITAMATAILNLLPLAMQKLGEGIIAFADVIGSSGPALVTAFVTLIKSMLDAVNTLAPQILATLMNLINSMLMAIQSNLPNFVSKGMTIIQGFIQGIANKIGAVVGAAINLIVNFINAIAGRLGQIIQAGTNLIVALIRGIGNSAGQIVDAAGDTIVKFMQGVASSIRTHSSEMRSAGRDIALAIADGMTGGLASKVGDVAAKAKSLAQGAIDGAKNLLHINSPSKVFTQFGIWTGEGYEIGLEKSTPAVAKASENMGKSAMSSMSKSMKNMSLSISDNIDANPTIRPVLDLDGIRSGASKINGMMGVASIKPTGSYASATNTAVGVEANRAAAAAASTSTSTVVHKDYKFEQTIKAPEAIGAGTVYRETKSLFAQLENELDN